MLVARLLPFVKNLCTRKWSDEDIIEDIQFLRDELETNFHSLTFVFLLILSFNIESSENFLPTQNLRRVQF